MTLCLTRRTPSEAAREAASETTCKSSKANGSKTDADLRGLVYSLTPHIKDDATARWYARPVTLGIIVLAVTVALNVIFW